MHKKIKEEINAVLFFIYYYYYFFAKYHSVNNIQHWKICYTTAVLQQTTVNVKYKYIKCKQSVEGSIISQILKLPYSNVDVNDMEIIQ